MGDIYNRDAHKLGEVASSGVVYDAGGHHVGKIAGGNVYGASGQLLGHISGGQVYRGGQHIGGAHADGVIMNASGERLGEAKPPHPEFGAAALLLLLQP